MTFSSFINAITFGVKSKGAQYFIFSLYIIIILGLLLALVLTPVCLKQRRLRKYKESLIVKDVCGNLLENRLLYFTTEKMNSLEQLVLNTAVKNISLTNRVNMDQMQYFIINLDESDKKSKEVPIIMGQFIPGYSKVELVKFCRLISANGYNNQILQQKFKLMFNIQASQSRVELLEAITQLLKLKEYREVCLLIFSLNEEECGELTAVLLERENITLSQYIEEYLPAKQSVTRLLSAWAGQIRYAHSNIKNDATSLFLSFDKSNFNISQLLLMLTTYSEDQFGELCTIISQMSKQPLLALITGEFKNDQLARFAFVLAYEFACNQKRGAWCALMTMKEHELTNILSAFAGDGNSQVALEEVAADGVVEETSHSSLWAQFIEGCKECR